MNKFGRRTSQMSCQLPRNTFRSLGGALQADLISHIWDSLMTHKQARLRNAQSLKPEQWVSIYLDIHSIYLSLTKATMANQSSSQYHDFMRRLAHKRRATAITARSHVVIPDAYNSACLLSERLMLGGTTNDADILEYNWYVVRIHYLDTGPDH